jgi:hypothetical protein
MNPSFDHIAIYTFSLQVSIQKSLHDHLLQQTKQTPCLDYQFKCDIILHNTVERTILSIPDMIKMLSTYSTEVSLWNS